jgi:hypothetical protein
VNPPPSNNGVHPTPRFMEATKLKLFESVDDPQACECPSNFDWQDSMSRVKASKSGLESLVGLTFLIDENVQDASFFTELAILGRERYVSGIGKIVGSKIVIRFSCFGNLFTVYSTSEDEKLEESIVEIIIAEVARHGFVYVEADGLEEKYTGVNPHLQGQSWWVRYFDYL